MNANKHLAQDRRGHRILWMVRKEAHLCKCGRKPEEGNKTCPRCQAVARKVIARRYRRVLPVKKAFRLCNILSCSGEAVPGFHYCGYHLEQNAERLKAQREAHIRDGKCARCNALPEPGKTCCKKHLAAMARAQSKYKAKKRQQHSTAA